MWFYLWDILKYDPHRMAFAFTFLMNSIVVNLNKYPMPVLGIPVCRVQKKNKTVKESLKLGQKRLGFLFIFILTSYWLVVLRIYMYVASAVFQPYRDLEAGDNQSLKS